MSLLDSFSSFFEGTSPSPATKGANGVVERLLDIERAGMRKRAHDLQQKAETALAAYGGAFENVPHNKRDLVEKQFLNAIDAAERLVKSNPDTDEATLWTEYARSKREWLESIPCSMSSMRAIDRKIADEDKAARAAYVAGGGAHFDIYTPEFELTQKVINAITKRGGVFQRSRLLVEAQLDPARNLPGLLRPTDELRMSSIGAARMRGIIAQCCTFYKSTRDGTEIAVHNVPEWLPSAILSRPAWPFPVIESIAENPTLRRDGTVHETPGYDDATGNFFDSDGVEFPPVPNEPTLEDARAAFATLMEPFCDFPFVAEHDRSVAAAAILTMLARPAIPGPTPPFVIKTPTPRTGKDLLTDVMTIIGTGRPTPGRNLPGDEAELKKLLLSLGIAGVRVVSFGNCEGAIGSAVLSHATTREVISDRFLGRNQDLTVALRPVWLFNGNNPHFRGDFGPRVVMLEMDAKCADPQSRSGWKYDPLLPHVKHERPRLAVAGLTILRAFHVAGRPQHGKPRKGSFESWDDLVRGALVWIGAADPLAGDAAVRLTHDADLEKLGTLLSAWRAAYGRNPATLGDAVERSKRGSSNEPIPPRDLALAFAAFDPRQGDNYNAASLAYHFRHHRGRPVDVGGEVLRLEMTSPRAGRAKVAAWYVLADGEAI